MSTTNCRIEFSRAQSRRDDTLLTVGFNLRKETRHATSLQSPAGTTLCTYNMCRPCGTLVQRSTFPIRRLKPTVNQVSSLRDFVLHRHLANDTTVVIVFIIDVTYFLHTHDINLK